MGTAASRHGDQFAVVVFVRHGQTDGNLSPRMVQGRIMDQKLNETGRQQAALVARRLSESEETRPAAVYSSDLTRAVDTAQMISAASGSHLVIDPELTERHMGSFQGWKVKDVMKSEAYKAFARGGRDQEIPGGGESLNQLSGRIVPRLNAIAEKHKGERVVVVSHETVIEEICRHADPAASSVRGKILNTSISVVHISGSDGRWILEKVGDDDHLTGRWLPAQ